MELNTIGDKIKSHYFILIIWVFFSSCQVEKNMIKVSTIKELNSAVKKAIPGHKILLANGTYENAEIIFTGHGNKDKPIVLTAQNPGKVVFTGLSNLKMAGEYLHASGLVFKNGHSPTSEVISFKNGTSEVCNNCRLTDCVIDNYNNPERFVRENWISIYGKNNIIDHNTLIEKRNMGVTLAIILNSQASQQNYHHVYDNYFGPRQNLGSNGGETLRIGTSHYSLTDSYTLVENNYFDKCDGEHEIISNKSGHNTYRGNVFYECRGTLTMRHGKYTLVEGNYFLGNRKPNTGGIRVINEYQTVRENYLSGITGYRFRGVLVIMNGVPDSPINRYNQVVGSEITNNVVVNSDYIQLCAGSDAERSAVPIGSSFSNNIIMSKSNTKPFTIYDDVSGISFKNNYINKSCVVPEQISEGFNHIEYTSALNQYNLLSPSSEWLNIIGFDTLKLPVLKSETGASYYPKKDNIIPFRSGKVVKVKPGINTLIDAMSKSDPGDILLLESEQRYLLTKDLIIHHPVSIISKDFKPTIQSEKQTFFRIENEGALELNNLKLDGAKSPDLVGNSVVATSRYSMNRNYRLIVKNCEVINLDVNHSFNFLKVSQHTMADTVLIDHTSFSNVTGDILPMAEEPEDLGIYNVEDVIITNSRFKNVQGTVAHIYRGGTDESTYGPIVRLQNNEFNNCGQGNQNDQKASLSFHGVQNLLIDECLWNNSAPLNLHLTNGEPISIIQNSQFINSKGIIANQENYIQKNISIKP